MSRNPKAPTRRLTAARREAVRRMWMDFQSTAYVDPAGEEEIPGASTWGIQVRKEPPDGQNDLVENVMLLVVHRMPLRNGLDLVVAADDSARIPEGGVFSIVDFDELKSDVQHLLLPEYAEMSESFLIVEPAHNRNPEWVGLGLEALFLSMAIEELRRPSDCLAIAQPLSNLSTGILVRSFAAIHRPVFEAMGFERFKDEGETTDTWLLTDWLYFERQLAGSLGRLGL